MISNIKTILLAYVLLGYALKGWRHLVRRGVYLSGKDIYTALQRVRFFF
jgi:hypothetical protein